MSVAKQTPQGRVIWITGLSGSGKTTLAKALQQLLPPPCLLLDGDELRSALGLFNCGYERSDRLKMAETYGRLCRLAADQGQTVVCATISLFHTAHEWNRNNLPHYFEVFLDMPKNVLMERDYKHVYGQNMKNVVGQTLMPEFPLNPDFIVRDPKLAPTTVAANIFSKLGERDNALEKPSFPLDRTI